MSEKDKKEEASKSAGINYGILKNAKIYSDNIVYQCERGHGFAAEKANHLIDLFKGKKAEHIGTDNVKNGADRIVNGINIQTKYCSSGSKCISECFENGKFRYVNMNGSLMQIEVPADFYDDSIKAMENRIKTGQVPGISDPKMAKDFIRKGHYTYQQAKNIAKFGNIDSIKYDALNGSVVSCTAMGISATISLAQAVWNGEDINTALKQSCVTGLRVGGITWVSSILTSQIGRTGLERSLRPSTDYIVNKMGHKTSAIIANGLRGSGKKIFGKAAMNNVSKLLRGNLVTGTLTVAVLSATDVSKLVKGSISKSQAFKNITVRASSVAAATGGTTSGAIIGTMILPGAGTFIGGLVGGTVAGSLAGKTSKKILDRFIKDDADSMLKVFEDTFSRLAFDFLLTENEINTVTDSFKGVFLEQELQKMFISTDPKEYAYSLIHPKIVDIVKLRVKVQLPSFEEITTTISDLLELTEGNNQL